MYPLPRIEEHIWWKDFFQAGLVPCIPSTATEHSITRIRHHQYLLYQALPLYQVAFRVTSAPAIFQCTIETLLRGLPMIVVYIDDILIAGRSQEEHHAYLAKVL